MHKTNLLFIIVTLFFLSCKKENPTFTYQWMEGFPHIEEGMEQGVSACYAGTLDDYLIMAGGCNFPDTPADEGGNKKYYKEIYAAHITKENTLDWRQVGTLPEEAAYGVSISLNNSILFIGGNNSEKSLRSVYEVSWKDETKKQVKIDSLTTLPFALDNMVGCKIDDYIYLAGGNKNGEPCNDVITLSMNHVEFGWEALPPFPGQARIQPICGTIEANFYLWGGFDLQSKQLALNGYYFDEQQKEWKELESPKDELGTIIFTGGGSAVSISNSIIAIGGVNKDIFQEGISNPSPDYMKYPAKWYRFNPYLLEYTIEGWKILERNIATARAGAALVYYHDTLFVIGGELKPGIRTPEIIRIKL